MTKNQKTEKVLTTKEKLFAELYVENFYSMTSKTNTQLAIEAGYAEESATPTWI